MGVSLYYEAKRNSPLTYQEKTMVEEIIQNHLKTYEFKNIGEDFDVYPYNTLDPSKIFCGATKLPMTEEADDMFSACLHWMNCLTDIRKSVLNAVWQVHLDDTELLWDDETGWFFADEF